MHAVPAAGSLGGNRSVAAQVQACKRVYRRLRQLLQTDLLTQGENEAHSRGSSQAPVAEELQPWSCGALAAQLYGKGTLCRRSWELCWAHCSPLRYLGLRPRCRVSPCRRVA
jgi:hypothetical protein